MAKLPDVPQRRVKIENIQVAGEELVAAILEGSALAEFIAAYLVTHPDDPSALQTAVADWVARSPGDDQARVVRIGGAQLLASTYPSDLRGVFPVPPTLRLPTLIAGSTGVWVCSQPAS
jgi:hypothetical protein